jgi:hypothetical protein
MAFQLHLLIQLFEYSKVYNQKNVITSGIYMLKRNNVELTRKIEEEGHDR